MRHQAVVRALKGRLRYLRNRSRRMYVRWIKPFDADDFAGLLRELGVVQGDTLLVHSSIRGFESYTDALASIVKVLQESVGATGTILMPNQPFGGSALDYVRNGHTYDVRKTPSAMGLISELFRRSSGVVRSVHPTHPVAIWGADANELIRNHHRSGTPCGRGTPYARFGQRDGKILLLGTGLSLTYYHSLEEKLESLMPFSPFTRETFELTSRTADGELVYTHNRLFDRDLSGRREIERAVPYLRARGAWREARVGTLRAIILRASDLEAVVHSMARNGEFCYRPG